MQDINKSMLIEMYNLLKALERYGVLQHASVDERTRIEKCLKVYEAQGEEKQAKMKEYQEFMNKKYDPNA